MTTNGSRRHEAGQKWDANLYNAQFSYVWNWGESLIDVLDPQPGEHILDIGSGTGHLAARIAESGAFVLGMDASEDMVREAKNQYPTIEFQQGDAAAFSFDDPFDAVFSNATLHWVGRPAEVAACVTAALKPGGRFVVEFGGRDNVKAVSDAVMAARATQGHPPVGTPWFFPTIGEYTPVLEMAGLEVTFAAWFEREAPQPEGDAGLRNWLQMYGSTMLDDLTEAQRAGVVAEAEERLKPQLYRNGTWYIDYRRIRVVARKPGDVQQQA